MWLQGRAPVSQRKALGSGPSIANTSACQPTSQKNKQGDSIMPESMLDTSMADKDSQARDLYFSSEIRETAARPHVAYHPSNLGWGGDGD